MKPYGGFRIAGAVWVLFACGARFFTGHCGHCRGRVPCGKHAVRSAQRHACRPDGPQAHPDCCRACKCRCRCGHGGELRPCGVCAAMALEALSFNLASGTLEALTYDTLAEAGQKSRYIQQTSRQYTLYSITQSAASPDERGHHSAGFVTRLSSQRMCGAWVCRPGRRNRAGYQCKAPCASAAAAAPPGGTCAGKRRFLLHRRRLAARMLCISLVCCRGLSYADVLAAGPCRRGSARRPGRRAAFSLMLADVPGALLAPRLPARLGSLFLGCGLAVSACTMLAGSACLPLSGRGSGCRASGKCIYSAGRQLDAAVLPQRQPRNFDQRGQHDVQHLHGGALPAGRRRRKRMGGGALHFLIGAGLMLATSAAGLFAHGKGESVMHVELVPFFFARAGRALRDIAAFWQHHAAPCKQRGNRGLGTGRRYLERMAGRRAYPLFHLGGWPTGPVFCTYSARGPL